MSLAPLLHQCQGVDYGEKLADIVGGGFDRAEMEYAPASGQVDALVFHTAGIAHA